MKRNNIKSLIIIKNETTNIFTLYSVENSNKYIFWSLPFTYFNTTYYCTLFYI